MANKKTIVKYLLMCLWLTAGGTVLGFLLAAAKQKDNRLCAGININIHDFNNNFFIDRKDIERTIVAKAGGDIQQLATGKINLVMLEEELEKNVWIKSAKLFFDNNDMLHVEIQEREPVARIFTTSGSTFYIDSALTKLPVTDTMAAHVQVFTGFPTDVRVLTAADSVLLQSIKSISMAIQQDSFMMALIDQVDISSQGHFEMIPKAGNHIIAFGDGNNVEEKFYRLKLFYKEVFTKAGTNYYSQINVQYSGQVVARRRGAVDITADSLRTIQIMQLIAENAAKQSADSLQIMQQDNSTNTADSSMINQSVERDEAVSNAPASPANPAVPVTNPAAVLQSNRPAVNTNARTVTTAAPKPKPPKPKPPPRAVMPRRNN